MKYSMAKNIFHTLSGILRTCYTATKRLFKEKYTYRASALAFTTLLALVPLISVIVSLIAVLPIFTKFATLAQNYILENFVPTSGNTIQNYLVQFTKQATHLPVIGIIFLFFTALLLIITVEHTLNDIWDVSRRKKSLLALLIYWLILFLSPIVIGFSLFLSSYLFSLKWIAHTTNALGITLPMLSCLPLVINTAIFSLLYVAVPNTPVRWRDGFLGGFIAAILFEVAKKGFAFYIHKFPSYELIYGTLAAIPIFLLWLYISWLIILLGALVTHTHSQQASE